MVSASDLTKSQITELQSIITRGQAQNAAPADIATAMEAISPELAGLVKPFTGNARVFMIVLMMLFFILSRCSVNVNLDANQLWEQMVESDEYTSSQDMNYKNEKGKSTSGHRRK